ncbi:acetoacetate-CoA ligase [Basidiobolus meristosporus CBS 931.73]|uniref:Acetoacetate-CoA ligase n=1 Tax=Basidiobolus meristosporus CBS 931.73 TaxID=1314790 RepID=A0A1Y1YHN7_9FUNG|nr:acetoacetate-CoA ligase [Basidiobolus meristosporus CBS 931.73]|eukprot:ORX97489.1 acetoacetate-CoA ligase [Basidiobolus meristosporus CBS 931.73]
MTQDLPSENVPRRLWTPTNPQATQMEKFRLFVNQKLGKTYANYEELYAWSCSNISDFWSAVWEYTGIIASIPYTQVVDESLKVSDLPEWFQGTRLNYAENLLWRQDDKVAIISTGEKREPSFLTYKELYAQVQVYAGALRKLGVTQGDRVVGYIPNCPEAIIAMLATASLGAIWSSTSPDFGISGVLDRFSQIKPKVLFSVNAIVYNGKVYDHQEKLRQVAEELDDLVATVLIPFVPSHPMEVQSLRKGVSLEEFLEKSDNAPLTFAQLPFDHPLFILFSSGTTGKPKCIVHRAGGMLIQHKKEHVIHGNLGENDVFFQYTTTGWMMWNWLVAGLSFGCTIVLYDGSPFKPGPEALWEMVDTYGITAFGTSAKYIQSLQDVNFKPNEHYKLSTLHSLYSTGSPLKPESFDYVYNCIKSDLCLGSITGGTDICSLFAGANTAASVYRGEIQTRCLGMAIEAWDGPEKPVFGQSGDLVCVKAFPCMPVYFWNDEDGSKYKGAYFDNYDGVWYHGDFVSINPVTGGVVMLGRSDGTLNPAGIRFGSAEIYNIVDNFNEIEDSLVVGQKQDVDERVVLFLKMAPGCEFNEDLVSRLKLKIRQQLSARHVPAIFLATPEIPHTIAVKRIISGQKYIPSGTLANPECLQFYYNLPELLQ